MIVDCMVSPWGCGLDGGVWIRHRFMVVRGFCFVKYGAGEIPAFAGMTKEERGNDVGGCGNDGDGGNDVGVWGNDVGVWGMTAGGGCDAGGRACR